MRAKLIIAALLWLALSSLGLAEPPRPSYTTLVVEFAGEMNRFIPPVVISTSSEEGEWYKQHLFPDPFHSLAHVQVVPASVLNKITELPLLERALESAKPSDEEPKTPNNVRFTAGVGHEHVQIMVDDQTSTKILKDIAGVVAKYPDLKSDLQEIADLVKPLTFHNVAMGEIEYKRATEAGFRTRGWPHPHFGFTCLELPTAML